MCSYPEDDNIALLIGLPPDDVVLMQRQNIWYRLVPILLYLIASASVYLYGHVVHLYVAVVSRLMSPLVTRLHRLSVISTVYRHCLSLACHQVTPLVCHQYRLPSLSVSGFDGCKPFKPIKPLMVLMYLMSSLCLKLLNPNKSI